MIETVAIGVLCVLVLLTFGTLFPIIPSGILASITVLAYWNHTGYAEPSILTVVSLVLLGLFVTVTDFASGAVAGKLGGASNISVVVGSVFGFILLFVIGPVGFIAGIAISVFTVSVYKEDKETKEALKTSIYTVIGVLASKVVQFLLMAILATSFGFFVVY